MQTNMHQAKTNLSQLAKSVHEGQTVIIAKAGKPYVQLVPVTANARQAGALLKAAPDYPFSADDDYLDSAADKEIADLFGA